MVEAISNGLEDYLIDGLSFKLGAGASYVTNRRSVTFHPSGSNIYKPSSGTKVIKMMLTGDSWLDPSTVKLQYTLENKGAHPLYLIGGPHVPFRRLRVLCGGQVVEDFDYNRTHEMFHVLTSANNRKMDSIEGFGQTWDDESTYSAVSSATALPAASLVSIGAGKKKTVSLKLLSGILNQPKYLPIRYCPITLELELVNSPSEICVSADGTNFSNRSEDWEITDVQCKSDVVTLDNALDNSYAEHLMSGKSLPINYNTYITQSQSVTGKDLAINISRAVTRLKSIFVTLKTNTLVGGSAANENLINKDWNGFYNPMRGTFDHDLELEWQVQIGSKLFPEYPVKCTAETASQLRKCMGIHTSTFHSFSITPQQFVNLHSILGIDTEKVLEAGFSGLNTRAGDLLTIKLKCPGVTGDLCNTLNVTLHSDQILEIRDTGVAVFD